jgi:hypothetical protein
MTDLVDDVKNSFEKSKDDVIGGHVEFGDGVSLVRHDVEELAPGFMAMRQYYNDMLLVVARRGYRHYAGSSMPTDSDQLLSLTAQFLRAPMIAVSLEAFADGVMIGQQTDHLIRMMTHFNALDHVFHDSHMRGKAMTMAHGFADDREVCEYFNTYLDGALTHISHVTGFAHSEVVPAKIWDVWILCGTAVISASYLAGQRMGASWRERDVLDGIEIASESQGQDEPHHRADEGDQGGLGSQ